jgi:hypothetical protein
LGRANGESVCPIDGSDGTLSTQLGGGGGLRLIKKFKDARESFLSLSFLFNFFFSLLFFPSFPGNG